MLPGLHCESLFRVCSSDNTIALSLEVTKSGLKKVSFIIDNQQINRLAQRCGYHILGLVRSSISIELKGRTGFHANTMPKESFNSGTYNTQSLHLFPSAISQWLTSPIPNLCRCRQQRVKRLLSDVRCTVSGFGTLVRD